MKTENMGDVSEWCLIDSDPAVITELMQKMGAKEATCEELWDISEEGMSDLGDAYGLIFLFKWKRGEDDHGVADTPGVFFAQQVIRNACATQAVLSILMNADDRIDIGEELTDFKSFTNDFDPEMKGLSISNSHTIRDVHNSFSQQSGYIVSQDQREEGDAFHFISYVPINGRLYELDGLKKGPVDLGPCELSKWLAVVRPVLQARIRKYQSSEIRFNLMAVIKDRRVAYKDELQNLRTALAKDENAETKSHIESRIVDLEDVISSENAKFDDWKATNKRRKYNYTPFIMNLFKILATDGRLQKLVDDAKQHKRQRIQ